LAVRDQMMLMASPARATSDATKAAQSLANRERDARC
jgi:hypothetical protein